MGSEETEDPGEEELGDGVGLYEAGQPNLTLELDRFLGPSGIDLADSLGCGPALEKGIG